MDAEYSAFQDALKGLKTATDLVNSTRANLHAAVDKKAADFGTQVASDTAATVPPKPAAAGVAGQ